MRGSSAPLCTALLMLLARVRGAGWVGTRPPERRARRLSSVRVAAAAAGAGALAAPPARCGL